MKKSSLFILFQALTQKEKKDFGLFLLSPYHNKQSELCNLLEYLNKIYQGKASSDKEKCWNFIFQQKAKIKSNKKFSDQKFRHLLSDTKKLLEKFLILEENELHPVQNQISLLSMLRKKGLEKALMKEIKNGKNLLLKKNERSALHQLKAYQINHEEYQYIHLNRRQGKMPLKEQIGHLTHYYIIESLRHACILHTYLKINPGSESIFLLKEICKAVESNQFDKNFAIKLYYNLYQSIIQPEESKYFEKAKHVLIQHGDQFNADELRDIYILAINYCIRKINKGQEKYKAEALTLYKYGLQEGSLLIDGVLSDFTYKNIAVLGISLEEFDWVNQILVNYKPFLDARTRENTFSYTMALVHYKRKEYDGAMDYLRNVTYSDTLNNLNARRMMMRIYYETGAMNALDSAIDSFQAYIRRQKDIGQYRESYQRLLKYMRKLANVNINDSAKLSVLSEDIQNSEAFPEKEWMVESIGKLVL